MVEAMGIEPMSALQRLPGPTSVAHSLKPPEAAGALSGNFPLRNFALGYREDDPRQGSCVIVLASTGPPNEQGFPRTQLTEGTTASGCP